MEEKFWTKFHALFGPDLKVGFETTFPKGTDLNLDPLYGKNGLVHELPGETVKRVYEPAIKVFGSCLDGDAAQVLFEPVLSENSLFKRLVFSRKVDHAGKARRQIVAARHNEIATFGFDSWNSKNQRYLSLAYPGLSKNFVPVYFKVQENGKNFVYLEMWAFDEGKGKHVTAQARRVRESEVPESLKNLEV